MCSLTIGNRSPTALFLCNVQENEHIPVLVKKHVIWWDISMAKTMLQKFFPYFENVVTYCTSKRSCYKWFDIQTRFWPVCAVLDFICMIFFWVIFFMPFQMWILYEWLLTWLAFVWPFSSMYSHMNLQVTNSCKRFFTQPTIVRLLSCMDQHVKFETSRLCKRLITE